MCVLAICIAFAIGFFKGWLWGRYFLKNTMKNDTFKNNLKGETK